MFSTLVRASRQRYAFFAVHKMASIVVTRQSSGKTSDYCHHRLYSNSDESKPFSEIPSKPHNSYHYKETTNMQAAVVQIFTILLYTVLLALATVNVQLSAYSNNENNEGSADL